jgi:hypothetical protein
MSESQEGRWTVRDGIFGIAVVSVKKDMILLECDPAPMLRPVGQRSGWAMTPARLRMTSEIAAELHRVLGRAVDMVRESDQTTPSKEM